MDETARDAIARLESDEAVLFLDVLDDDRVFTMVVLAVKSGLHQAGDVGLRTALREIRGLPTAPDALRLDAYGPSVAKWTRQCKASLSRNRGDRHYQTVVKVFAPDYIRVLNLMMIPEIQRLSERRRRAVATAVHARRND